MARVFVCRTHPSRCARVAIAVALLAAAAAPTPAAEKLSAAHASIRATEAGRHIHALADDAFEGREGGSRGGRAAGTYIVDQIAKFGLEPAGDGGGYYQSFGGMRNILALVRGSDPQLAGELIVVGAHYDHVGYGNSSNSFGPFGYVHNGADDNASGVAGLIEVAEALQHLPARPRRSILIVFWDGEEKGLLGSRHFLRVRTEATRELKTVFSINLDMIGRLRGQRLEVYGARSALGLRAAVVAANNAPVNAAGLELSFDWDISEDSDHYAFIMAGVPTVMFHTGLHDQYHRPSDDAHLVHLDGIEPVARLTLGLVVAIADDQGPVPAFRPQCRGESNATRRSLEAVVASPVGERRGRWGIGTRSDPGEPSTPVIVRVTPDSPAARGGLVPGDRLVAIDGLAVAGQDDMVHRLSAAAARVVLDIDRKGRFMQVALEDGDKKTAGP